MEEKQTMSVREAAIQVLQEAGEPLHVQEITKRILSQGLWQTTGKTPATTVSACLYTDIKKYGDASPFVRVGSRTFGLRALGSVGLRLGSVPIDMAIDTQIDKSIDKPIGTLRDEKPAATDAKPTPPLESESGTSISDTSINDTSEKVAAKSYSFTDAAEKVLEQFGDKRPMHYRAITEKALSMGWLATEGKTPEATLYAQILTEIKRHKKTGEQPRFAKHGRGYIGLTRWMGRGIAFEVEQHNKQVRQALHKQLLGMDPVEFEEFISLLLAEIGFEDIEVTRRSGDGGIVGVLPASLHEN